MTAARSARWILAAWLLGAAAAFTLGRLVLWPSNRTGPTIVLISIDTLRADHVGAYGYAPSPTPTLDALAARGARFADAVVPFPATDPSHATMLTGQRPMAVGLVANGMKLPDGIPTVASLLHDAGYETVGATSVYHLSRQYGFAQGFDRFSDTPQGLTRDADRVNADVLHLIDEHVASHSARPLFLFVHYFDVHGPYIDREGGGTDEWTAAHGPEMPPAATATEVIRSYDSGIRFVDRHVAEVLAALDRAGLSKNLYVFVTADHGEQLGEHGYFGGHEDIYTETIRVPLIIAGPEIGPQVVHEMVSSMSIAPTILQFAGVTPPSVMTRPGLAASLRGARGFPAEQPMLVLGQPWYTRSLAVRAGHMYFIRNLEDVYMHLEVGAPAATPLPRQAALETRGDSRMFAIPPIDFEPYAITADVRIQPGCEADVSLVIPPGVAIVNTLHVTSSVRLRYQVARLDPSYIGVRPLRCATDVSWDFVRASAAAAVDSQRATDTDLAHQLMTWRTKRSGDELYDLTRDPQMTANLLEGGVAAGDIASLLQVLEERFVSTARPPVGPQLYAPEELERLRSLGYIR